MGRRGELYLLLGEIIWKVCNHDLGLGWDTVGRRPALATSLTGRGLAVLVLGLGSRRQVGGVGQGKRLASSSDLRTFLTLGLAGYQYVGRCI